MPFFENAGAVSVVGGTFYDITDNHVVAHSLSSHKEDNSESHGVGRGGGGNINSMNVQGTYSEFRHTLC
jgi:hypothetical protein